MILFYFLFLYCINKNKSTGGYFCNQYTIDISTNNLIDTLNENQALNLSLISIIDFKTITDHPIYSFVLSKTDKYVRILLFLSPEHLNFLDEDENEVFFLFTEYKKEAPLDSNCDGVYDNYYPMLRRKEILLNTNIISKDSNVICKGKRSDVKGLILKNLFYKIFNYDELEERKYCFFKNTLKEINVKLESIIIRMNSKDIKNNLHNENFNDDADKDSVEIRKFHTFLNKLIEEDFQNKDLNFYKLIQNEMSKIIKNISVLYYKLLDSGFFHYVLPELKDEDSLSGYLIFFDFLNFLTCNRFYPQKFFLKQSNSEITSFERTENPQTSMNFELPSNNNNYISIAEISRHFKKNIHKNSCNKDCKAKKEAEKINKCCNETVQNLENTAPKTEAFKEEIAKTICFQCRKTLCCCLKRSLEDKNPPLKDVNVYDIPRKSSIYDVPKRDLTYDVPRKSSIYDVPKRDLTYDVPRKSSIHDVSKRDLTYDVPRKSSIYDVPRRSLTHDVPKKNLTYEVLRKSSIYDVPRRDATRVIPKEDPISNFIVDYQYKDKDDEIKALNFIEIQNRRNIRKSKPHFTPENKNLINQVIESNNLENLGKTISDVKIKKDESITKNKTTFRFKRKDSRTDFLNKIKQRAEFSFLISKIYKMLGKTNLYIPKTKITDKTDSKAELKENSSSKVDKASINNIEEENHKEDNHLLKEDYSCFLSDYEHVYNLSKSHTTNDILTEKVKYNDFLKLTSVWNIDKLDKHMRFYCFRLNNINISSKDITKLKIHLSCRDSSITETHTFIKEKGEFKVFNYEHGVFVLIQLFFLTHFENQRFTVKFINDEGIILDRTENCTFRFIK